MGIYNKIFTIVVFISLLYAIPDFSIEKGKKPPRFCFYNSFNLSA